MARVAILGLGGVAERIHLPACAALPDVQLVGACEPDDERRELMRRRFGLPAVYADAETLLKKGSPEIVIIGTPPDSHKELCLLALEHGAHVLCEKPFVNTIEEADAVISAADRKGLRVAVNNQYRYMEIYRSTRERLVKGEFGRLFFVQVWQQMFHPPTQERGWRARLKQSTLYEFGTHALDLICFFFDALPASVSAHTPRVRPEIDSDVLVQATLRFPEERLATLALNRVSHAPNRYLEMRLDCERASVRISLGGIARAALDWSYLIRRPILRWTIVKGGEARAEAGGRSRVVARDATRAYASATAAHLRKFIGEIQSGKGSNDAARHAREVLRTVFACYESARTGQTQWLAPAHPQVFR